MGIAAYNRGSRAISAHIDQQLRERNEVKVLTPGKMWTPPKGWFQAAIAARLQREDQQFRIEDNERRQRAGLPTYEI